MYSTSGPLTTSGYSERGYHRRGLTPGVCLGCRINLPSRKRRERLKELERASPRESYVEADLETVSEASSEQDYSYEFAQMEVIMKTLGNNGTAGVSRLSVPWTLDQ